jgi:hypothetical protein
MSDERKLTEEDREKIQRLLESGTPGNIVLALGLIEETAAQVDIAAIFTKDVIVALICLEDPLVIVRAGSLISKCSKTWKTFADTLANPLVMTSRDYWIRTVELSEVTAFSQGALAELVNDEFDIDLAGLTTLSVAAAKLLGKHHGPLKINGLTKLSDDCAKNLSKHVGGLNLNGLTELSDASARYLGKHEGTLDLNSLTELSEASAKHLSNHIGELWLNGLTELSEAAALQLAAHKELQTNGEISREIKKAVSNKKKQARKSKRTGKSKLTKTQKSKIRKLLRSKSAENTEVAVQLIDISEATKDDISDVLSASVLSLLINTWDVAIWNSLAPLLNTYSNAKREFTELSEKRLHQKFESSYKQQNEAKDFLNSFYKDLTKPTALLELKFLDIIPGRLYLDLTELSDVAAESLSGQKGGLCFYYLTVLSDSAAESLSRFKGDLTLSSITSLSDAAAQSLGDHDGSINLSELTSLSDAGAMSLSKHRGHIKVYVSNLVSVLSDDKAYSSMPGHVALLKKIGVEGLSLESLTSLGDFAAEILSKHSCDLFLGGIKQLSDTAAKSLSKHKGQLDLSGLTKLSDSVAKSLSKHQGLPTYCYNGYDDAKLDGLDLSGLTTLCNSTIKSLAKSKGRLDLSGLKQLSDEAAGFLSKHDGILVMDGLTKLSDAAALSLSKHELHLELGGITTISDVGAKSLGTNQRRKTGGGAYHMYSDILDTATGRDVTSRWR